MARHFGESDFYPHQPDEVEEIQTHASYVFIARPFVFKIKKPVDLEFLDYATLEKRKHFCEQEVALNRRLCAQIYEGVVPIYGANDRLSLAEEEGMEVVEYAVKMRYLEDRYFLHRKIANGTIAEQDVLQLAQKLAPFYRDQEPDEEIRAYGTVEKKRANTDENFSQTESFKGSLLEPYHFDAIRRFTDQFLDRFAPLFQQRMDRDAIIDGHGDLHLEHIHIAGEEVCIYDCIEFNRRFRYLDWADDLSFLAMDFDYRRTPELGQLLIDTMRKELEDPNLTRILDFYKCYKAYVRGKVEGIKSEDEEVPDDQREESRQSASKHFNLALRYAALGSKPFVVVLMGQIGTGKSTLGKHLAETLLLRYFNSDRIRKEIAGLPLHELTPKPIQDELYSDEMSRETYRTMYQRALDQAEQQRHVVIDATFSRTYKRENLIEMLAEDDVNYCFIETRANEQVIRERLRSRDSRDDVISDARLETYEELRSVYEPPEEIPDHHLIRVDTDRPVAETLREIYLGLVNRHLDRIEQNR